MGATETLSQWFEPLSCSLKQRRASMKMSNYESKYSPGYRHMICIGKAKSSNEKGLFVVFHFIFGHWPFVRAKRGTVGVIGLFESAKELCHWWKCGLMNSE